MSLASLIRLIFAGCAAGVFLALISCGESSGLSTPPDPTAPPAPPPPAAPSEPIEVTEARALYPRTLELHSKVIARTCSPNPGVCHQTNNYPDLKTPGALLALLRAPCNLDIPEPQQGWDSCERNADKLRAGSVLTDIAWIKQRSAGTWRVAFKDPALQAGRVPMEIFAHDGQDAVFAPPVEWDVGVNLVAGEREADLTAGYPDPYLTQYVDSILETVIGGDPNQNGIYGASDQSVAHGSLIEPGSLERSYLWGRITGTVPGSRMPLANQPLSQAEYVALACFIEGLAKIEVPAALDPIDYDNCAFADSPILYALD